MEILEDLIQMFESLDKRYVDLKKQIQYNVEDEMYDSISLLDASKKECFSYRKNLKEFIRKNYEKELYEMIKIQENIVENERINSEMATDFNLSEKKAIEKLEILKKIK